MSLEAGSREPEPDRGPGLPTRPRRRPDSRRAERHARPGRGARSATSASSRSPRVKMSPDLQLARVHYTSLGDAAARKKTAARARARHAVPAAPDRPAAAAAAGAGARVPVRRIHRPPGPHRADPPGPEGRRRAAERRRPAPPRSSPPAAGRRPTIVIEATLDQVVAAIRARQRFVITSHARPDGDAIGSQVAMALALRALGKDVRLVDADPPPPPMRELPGVELIEVTTAHRRPGRRRDHDGVRRHRAAGRGRARARVRDQHRSPPGQRGVRRAELDRPLGRGVRRNGLRPDRRAGRAADGRDRDAHLSDDPDGHRPVPLLAHDAAHLRDLPPVRGSRDGSHGALARDLRQQQPGPCAALRRRAGPHDAGPHRAHRHAGRWTGRWRRGAAAPTTTPRGSSTFR